MVPSGSSTEFAFARGCGIGRSAVNVGVGAERSMRDEIAVVVPPNLFLPPYTTISTWRPGASGNRTAFGYSNSGARGAGPVSMRQFEGSRKLVVSPANVKM